MDGTYTTPTGTEVTFTYSLVDAYDGRPKVPAHHRVEASVAGAPVGFLTWRDELPREQAGEVMDIKVNDRQLQGQGIATAMYRFAQQTGLPIRHSDSRTIAGDSWAESTGDPVPPLRERITGYHAGQRAAAFGGRAVKKVRVMKAPAISVSREDNGAVLFEVQDYAVGQTVAVFRCGPGQARELAEALTSLTKGEVES